MFCKHCGKEVLDQAVICPNCGCAVRDEALAQEGKPWSSGNMTALCIGTAVMPLVGIVAGIAGLVMPGKKSQAGILFAVAFVSFCVWMAIRG